MCNCIKEVEQRMFEHCKEQCSTSAVEEKILEGEEFGLEGTALFLSPSKEKEEITPVQLTSVFTYSYVSRKKNGIWSTKKKAKVNVSFTFCPFCGELYKKTKVTDEGETIS